MRKDDIDTRFPIGTATLFQGYQSEAAVERARERKDRVAFCYSRLAQLARLSGDVQAVAVSLAELHMARWAIGDFDRSLDALVEAAHRLDSAGPQPPGGALTTAEVRQRMQEVVLTTVQPMLAEGRTSDAFEFLTERHGDLEKARAVYAGAVACADALGMPQLQATATAELSRLADAPNSRT